MKGDEIAMVLFIILLLTLIVLVTFTALAVSIGGAAVIIIFGDVIVCIFLIVWLLQKLIKRRK